VAIASPPPSFCNRMPFAMIKLPLLALNPRTAGRHRTVCRDDGVIGVVARSEVTIHLPAGTSKPLLIIADAAAREARN
jgi:hypothetical protein